MAMFLLDTGAVSASMSSIESLVSKFENLASKMEGLDVSSDNEFNFAGAKSAIVSNLNACTIKVSNAAKVIENVISAHSSLQGKMKFEGNSVDSTNSSRSSSGNRQQGSSYVSTRNNNSYTNNNYSSTGYVAPPSTTSTPSVGVSNNTPIVNNPPTNSVLDSNISNGTIIGNMTSGDVILGMGVAGGTLVISSLGVDPDKWKEIKSITTQYLTDDKSLAIAKKYGLPALPAGAEETDSGLSIPGCSFKLDDLTVSSDEVIGLPVKGVDNVVMVDNEEKPVLWDYGYSDKSNNKHLYSGIDKITCQKTLDVTYNSTLNSIKYDSEGYATIDGRYVISCDSYFGKVGDKVQIITEDGTLECIIGDTPVGVKKELTFLINETCDGASLKNKITMTNIKSINNLEYADNSVEEDYEFVLDEGEENNV